jgi:hypothetical protein
MLYALRYQKQQANNIATLISSLVEQGVSKEEAKVINILLLYLLFCSSQATAGICGP